MLKRGLMFFALITGFSVLLTAQNNNVFITRAELRDGQKWIVITGYTGNEKSVVIPVSIDGVPVRKIGDMAFKLKGLTDLVLPQGLETIGDQAFFGNQLSIVVIPTSVRVIADSAFDSNMLKRVTNADLTENSKNPVKSKVYYVASDKQHLTAELLERATGLYGNFYNPLTGYDGTFNPVSGSNAAPATPKEPVKDTSEKKYGASSVKNSIAPLSSYSEPVARESVQTTYGAQPADKQAFSKTTVIVQSYPAAAPAAPAVQTSSMKPVATQIYPAKAPAAQSYSAAVPEAQTGVVKPPVEQVSTTTVTTSTTAIVPPPPVSAPAASQSLGDKKDIYSQVYIEVPGDYTGVSSIPVINSKTITKDGTQVNNTPPFSETAKAAPAMSKARQGIGKFEYKNRGLESFTIPEGTTFIGEGAFASNNLSSIVIPDSVRSIGSQAFMGNNLGDITIGENVLIQSDSFRYQFSDYYRMNNYKAGTYVLKAGHWNLSGQELPPKYVQ
ncbi:MAG: leucine-rich repeat domain-containing protein [Spirochaetaceae bacterium]|jgi:hypothetical protein|nr:leucine-rich repeat domain-containing protein [Spirochaetaceae bacterium]